MRRKNSAAQRRRKEPAPGVVAAKNAKGVKHSGPVVASRTMSSQVAKTSTKKQTRRGRAPNASGNAPGTKGTTRRGISILTISSKSHSTWTAHRGVSVDSWGSTPSAESVEVRFTEKALSALSRQSEQDDDPKLLEPVGAPAAEEALPNRSEHDDEAKPAFSPAGLSSIALTESTERPLNCDLTQDRPGPGPDSTQLKGVMHSDSSGIKIHLLPVNSSAEDIVRNTISFLSEVWKPELIPSIFALRYSIIETEDEATSKVRINSSGSLIPTARFVEEILARSRTTPAVLQVAMTYLEALRPHLSNHQAQACAKNMNVCDSPTDKPMTLEHCNEQRVILACLPSPLLCPRRMFLAALILAWKFVEDVFIPNREWATLADLPVWEVSRCERALGSALDWQLWPTIYRDAALQNE